MALAIGARLLAQVKVYIDSNNCSWFGVIMKSFYVTVVSLN